jgi:hypothetical protein
MPMLYDVTELATALKPWLFGDLLAREQTELLYFDPDIEIFSPVDRPKWLGILVCIFASPQLLWHLCSGTAKEYRQLRQPTVSNNQLTCHLFKQHIEIAQGALAIVAPGFCQ